MTRSTGMGASPLAARRAATRSVTSWTSLALVGPRLVPAEAMPSYPAPAADGRPQKYFGSSNAWPMRLEPSVLPSTVMNEPFAWLGNATWAMAVTRAGYSRPVMRVRTMSSPMAGRTWVLECGTHGGRFLRP